MGRTCTICHHPKRQEIDKALVRGESLGTIAARSGTSKSSVKRHSDSCISRQLAKAKEAKEVSDVKAASELVKELLELTQKAASVLARAMREKDGELALKAIARMERQLELKARLLGELEDRGTNLQRIEVVYVEKLIAGPYGKDKLAVQGKEAVQVVPAHAEVVAP